jgi:hypothetical protein
MQKAWQLTTIKDGAPAADYFLSHQDAVQAIDQMSRGGDIESLIRPRQPIALEVRRIETATEAAIAA